MNGVLTRRKRSNGAEAPISRRHEAIRKRWQREPIYQYLKEQRVAGDDLAWFVASIPGPCVSCGVKSDLSMTCQDQVVNPGLYHWEPSTGRMISVYASLPGWEDAVNWPVVDIFTDDEKEKGAK